MKPARALPFLLGVVVLTTVGALGSSPAGADLDTSVEFRFPASGQNPREWTPEEGSVLTGIWRIVADASASSSLASFSVAIEPNDDSRPAGDGSVLLRTYSTGSQNSDRINMPWNTAKLTPYNGSYRLLASAGSHVGGQASAQVLYLKVNNPPTRPTGLAVKAGSSPPKLEWKPNPEPDIVAYQILRTEPNGPPQKITKTSALAFEDTSAPDGVELRYQVVAVRSSPISSTGIASAPSSTITVVPTSSAGGSVIEEAPAAHTAPQPQSSVVTGPRRDLGYRPYLPYQGMAENVPQVGTPLATNDEGTFVARRVRKGAVEGTAYKPLYAAAGLVLLVAAMHLARLAARLFSIPTR